jgi:hypothetical protein
MPEPLSSDKNVQAAIETFVEHLAEVLGARGEAFDLDELRAFVLPRVTEVIEELDDN